jgi:hypothetical protein
MAKEYRTDVIVTLRPDRVKLFRPFHRINTGGHQATESVPCVATCLNRDFPFGIAWNHSRLGMLLITTARP